MSKTEKCMKMVRNILWMWILLTLCCCDYSNGNKKEICEEDIGKKEDYSSQPVIYLQPYNGFTAKEAEQVKTELATYLSYIHEEMDINILPTTTLDNSFLNDARSRYRSDKIVGHLKKKANRDAVYIGLLHEDISMPYKGRPDWGVMGQSFRGSNAAVASTFRVKNKKDYWKVVVHEFIHAYFNFGHCPDDNPVCIMKDAKGRAFSPQQKTLCPKCKDRIHQTIQSKRL